MKIENLQTNSCLSIVPITEGEKKPHTILGPKHDLLTRRASSEEIEKFVNAGVTSWAIANGKVSNNLVTLDFDEKHYLGLYDLWYARLSDDQRAVIDTCAINNTRNKGHHVRYCTETPRPTTKLSRRVIDEKIETTSEVRGEGSYALIPPSAGYTLIQGDLNNLPFVTDEMHEEFIDILRTFDEVVDEPATEHEYRPTDTATGDRPGDRLNVLMSWDEILVPHGWVKESANQWRRPDKKAGEGISATTNYKGIPMFYVFSSAAAPFTENKGYDKFHVFALLEYKGDFKAAAVAAAKLYQSEWKEKRAGNENVSKYEKKTTEPRAITVCMADVQPESVSWLWPGRIARGKLTLIAGDPGLGKSLVTATLAATVSKGYKWPLEDSSAPVGSVVFLSAEDAPGDTIRPRLDAAEADCTRIHVLQAVKDTDADGKPVERMFSLQNDIKVLEELLPSIPDCHLLVIDPISAYLDGADSYNNSDVRGLLAPLAKLADDHDVAVILIQHLNKSSGGSAMYRSMGSVAFIAAARAAYIVTKDQQDPNRRLVMPVKNNLAKDNTGLAYSITEASNGQPVIVWELEPVTITADEALSPSDANEKTDTEWGATVLLAILVNGPVPAVQVRKEAKEAGLSDKQLRRAGEKLGIKPKKIDFKGGWVWSLPQHEDALKREDAHPLDDGALGDEGHLGDEKQCLAVSEPQNDGRVVLAVGSADSVLFSDN